MVKAGGQGGSTPTQKFGKIEGASRQRRRAPWARATKKVHKPPGEKGRMFRKSKILLGPKVTFFIF
jgi:hypothetical protein